MRRISIGRKLVLGCAVLALPVGMITVVGVQAASAGSPPVTGTGTVSCTGATGLLGFKPPLTFSGSSPETASIKVTLHGCHAGGTTNVTTSNFNGSGKGSLSTSTNNCTALAGTQPVSGSVTIKWTGKAGTAKLNTTTLTLTSITGVPSGANGNAGFTFSHQATSGTFAGSLSGELDSNQTASTLAGPSGCGAKKGMKKINIVSGTASQP
jgi:hypothetical protein